MTHRAQAQCEHSMPHTRETVITETCAHHNLYVQIILRATNILLHVDFSTASTAQKAHSNLSLRNTGMSLFIGLFSSLDGKPNYTLSIISNK